MGFGSRRTLRRRVRKPAGLPDGWKRGLMNAFGLESGCLLVGRGGQKFRFCRIGGLCADRRTPWVWAYKLKKNGGLYAEPTKLYRWEKVCTT